MPRVTVKGLTSANELLEHEITLLKQENGVLKTEVQEHRDRSRSRRRKVDFKVEPISSRTRMALDLVCKRDRDHVIDEQRATIAKQAKEIESLKRGEGLIKPVLCAAFDADGIHDFNTIIKQSQTVREHLKYLFSQHDSLSSALLFGDPKCRRYL